jgi:DNA-binding LacI/PurR family transcriptional regulator
MGKMAVNIVAERLKPEQLGKASAVHRKLVPRLVVRSSTCKVNQE